MKKVGFINMGHSDGKEVYRDLMNALGPDIEVTVTGVLDNTPRAEIDTVFSFEKGENYIVTEVPWGGTVHISEAKARKEVCRIAEQMYDDGIECVLVICTGDFDRPASGRGLFLMPEQLMMGNLRGLGAKRIGFIVPESGQIPESEIFYKELNPLVRSASPYGKMEDLAATAASFRNEDVDFIVTDCMGFTPAMGKLVSQESGKPVFVPRLILPKLIRALLLQE